jgi:ABC-type bacteriocin/lantibiotic exporter with double-glycine peptidase domain
MRMQSSEANCGSTALSNALAAIGIKRGLDECEKLCGVTAEQGTSVFKLIDVASTIRRNPTVINCKDKYAYLVLCDGLRNGRSAILCVDENEHYVAAVGIIGKRVLVADSALNELVVSYSETKLLDRWAPDYWGLIL